MGFLPDALFLPSLQLVGINLSGTLSYSAIMVFHRTWPATTGARDASLMPRYISSVPGPAAPLRHALGQIVAVAGFFLDQNTVRAQLTTEAASLIGQEGAATIEVMIDNAGWDEDAGIVTTVIGVVTLLVGATGAFSQLQTALNTIWEASAGPDRSSAGRFPQE
jgi:hypothetical protein